MLELRPRMIQAKPKTPRSAPLVIARMVASAITVAIPLLLARKLTMAEYGTYKQAFLLCAPILTILPLGMLQSLYFFVPRTSAPRVVLLQTQLFNLVMGCVASLSIWWLLPIVATRFSNPALLAFRSNLLAYGFLVLASNCLEPTLTTQGKTSESATVYVASEIGKSAALLAPVLLGYGLSGALWGMAAFAAARAVVTCVLVWKAPGGRPRWSDFKAQLTYAVPFGAAMAFNVPQQVAHQYAVGFFVSPEVFAAYAAGCFQLPLVDLLYQPTSEVLMVRVGQLDAEGRLHEAVALFRDASAKLATFFIPLSAFLFISAPAVVTTLFGERFHDAVPVFRVSVLAVVLTSLPMDGLLRARNETRFLFWVYLTKAIATVPLLWLAVPRFGAMGGITSWLAVEMLGKAMLLSRVPRALSVAGASAPKLSDVVPVRHLLRTAVVAVVGSAVVLAAGNGFERLSFMSGRSGAMATSVAQGALFAVATLVGLVAFGMRPLELLGLGGSSSARQARGA